MNINSNSSNNKKKKPSNYQYFKDLFKESIYVASREYHEGTDDNNLPGKISILPTKPLLTQNDLSLAYSPGVAAPCYEIFDDSYSLYRYTAKGNTVAVISDGSAILGLGDLGSDASLPVMEGKAVLFKKFSGIDSIPIVINSRDTDHIINTIASISESWGGINLEDISGPRCFEIEERLQKMLDIPVFHDDQHGTAIVCGAGLINALDITKQKIEDIKMIVCGAGAAGIACLKFFILLGVKKENIILCDRDGVVYEGRKEGMDSIKAQFALKTDKYKTLDDAIKGANVFIGLSSAGALTNEMLMSMAPNPIVFAMANPEPEIRPEIAKSLRSDVIIATGRSDYPNQVNNVMGFPYIFRGALDVHARKINDEMKLAAAYAIANLARQPIHDDVFTSYSGRNFEYGPDYIIPVPFDPRLIGIVSSAVAEAAMKSGVARKNISDIEAYKRKLTAKLDPTINLFQLLHEKVKVNPKRIIFAEGEEEKVLRAALQWVEGGYGSAILVGDKETVEKVAENIGIKLAGNSKIVIMNSSICSEKDINRYVEYYYKRNQRKGKLLRDCVREVKTDRNIFASCILGCGDGDGMITGITRNYYEALKDIKRAIDSEDLIFGISAIITKGKTVFMADTAINDSPNSEDLAQIAIRSAKIVQAIGHVPRVALLSYATFGNPYDGTRAGVIRDAAEILRSNTALNFEWDGEMSAEVALNQELLNKYPFSNLTKPANILITPGLHSADISQKLIKSLTDAILVGPILIGFKNPVQILPMNASVSEIVNMAALTASGILD
jgi:malate dehydrogenase (oxaloacetate-decarboxylating)(NADP+)